MQCCGGVLWRGGVNQEDDRCGIGVRRQAIRAEAGVDIRRAVFSALGSVSPIAGRETETGFRRCGLSG
jgi:hypothetical protein